jgi:hypothetical protein
MNMDEYKHLTEDGKALLHRLGFVKVNYYAKQYYINDHYRDLHAVSGALQIEYDGTFGMHCRSFVYDQIVSDIEILRKKGIIK